MDGGGQESRLRAGRTENVAGIVGMAKALGLARARAREEASRLEPLRDFLIEGVLREEPRARLDRPSRKEIATRRLLRPAPRCNADGTPSIARSLWDWRFFWVCLYLLGFGAVSRADSDGSIPPTQAAAASASRLEAAPRGSNSTTSSRNLACSVATLIGMAPVLSVIHGGTTGGGPPKNRSRDR